MLMEGGTKLQKSHAPTSWPITGDKTVKIWSLTDYTCVKTLEGHTAGVLKVCGS